MKGFLKFVVFVAVVVAALYLARPHIEKYIADQKEAKESEAKEQAAERGEAKGAKAREVPPTKMEVAPAPAGASPSEIEESVMALYPDPVIPPLVEMVNDWNFIPERAFPRKLVLREAVDFELVRDGKVIGKRGVTPGSPIIAKAYSEMRVKISPENSDLMVAIVPIDATSLKESIQKGYDAFVADSIKRVEAQREAEKKRIANMKADAAEREKLLAGWTDGSDSVFDPMKVSLSNGDLKGLGLEDALRWYWLGKEEIGGTPYETGLVGIQVETIFGVFSTEWKALIWDGKVAKWVDPVTGEEN